MKLLRKLLNLRVIYFRQTSRQIIRDFFTAVAVIWIAGSIIGTGLYVSPYMLGPLFLIPVYVLLRAVVRTVAVNRYLRGYPRTLQEISPKEIKEASINLELDTIDRFRPVSVHGNARLFLATFDFYRRAKHESYLSKQAYYLVMVLQLNRVLPHILFDSKIAKREQFRHMYLRAQRISVQGSFDDIFDTYVPQTYAIDSLSFITPEVMEALIAASRYDIEIINDQLFLYAPLLDEAEIEAFAAAGQAVAKELNDNIDTYRDNRLSGNERLTNVTPFARLLLKSSARYLWISGVLAVVVIGLIIWSLSQPLAHRAAVLLHYGSIMVYILLLVNVFKAGKIMRENRKALESHKILYGGQVKPVKSTII